MAKVMEERLTKLEQRVTVLEECLDELFEWYQGEDSYTAALGEAVRTLQKQAWRKLIVKVN